MNNETQNIAGSMNYNASDLSHSTIINQSNAVKIKSKNTLNRESLKKKNLIKQIIFAPFPTPLKKK
jgi:hypothetical protein